MAKIEENLCARKQAFPGYHEGTAKAQCRPESEVPLNLLVRQLHQSQKTSTNLQNLLLAQSGQLVFIVIVCILSLTLKACAFYLNLGMKGIGILRTLGTLRLIRYFHGDQYSMNVVGRGNKKR